MVREVAHGRHVQNVEHLGRLVVAAATRYLALTTLREELGGVRCVPQHLINPRGMRQKLVDRLVARVVPQLRMTLFPHTDLDHAIVRTGHQHVAVRIPVDRVDLALRLRPASHAHLVAGEQLDGRLVLQAHVDDAVQVVHQRHLVVVAPARVQQNHYASVPPAVHTVGTQLQQPVATLLPLVHDARVRFYLPRAVFPPVDVEGGKRAAHQQAVVVRREGHREHRALEVLQPLLQLTRGRPYAHFSLVGRTHDLLAVGLCLNSLRFPNAPIDGGNVIFLLTQHLRIHFLRIRNKRLFQFLLSGVPHAH